MGADPGVCVAPRIGNQHLQLRFVSTAFSLDSLLLGRLHIQSAAEQVKKKKVYIFSVFVIYYLNPVLGGRVTNYHYCSLFKNKKLKYI